MKGILLIDKPEGWTSFDVVNYIRRKVASVEGSKPRNIKVGHTGTLDPAATGLLVVCVGRDYTKLVPTLIKQDKTYIVEVTLGKISTTGDKEGDITDSNVEMIQPSRKDIESTLKVFVGVVSQIPPAHSAIKINGKRAYQLAREGKKVAMSARTVEIHRIVIDEYSYPILRFTTHVGSGTYIRSLARDIGDKLGVGAYMSNLRRVSVGKYVLDESYAISDVTEENLPKMLLNDGCSAIITPKNDRSKE